MDPSAGVDILLVEDNPDHAEFTRKALAADEGVRHVYWVKDGQEALDFLHHRNRWADSKSSPRPALILLDIHLPKLNGHEVLRKVKADAEFRSIPVVMLTTSDRKEEVEATYSAGANSYVTKPVDFAEFTERIKLLKRYWTLTSQLPTPEVSAAVAASRPPVTPRPAPRAPAPHVLVIEANAEARGMMQHAVEQAGMRVTAVASASDALAVVEASPVDLVVTDVALEPDGRDGVWLLNRLLERSPNLPVVAMTGHEERAHELVEMGFASVVFKPAAMVKDLVAIVRGVMRR